jgi:hypothetical protein
MSVTNHGPFNIAATNGMEFRMFVCDDGIVIVRPSFIRHFPGQLASGLLGGAIGGGIGAGIEGAMGTNEYRKADQKAGTTGFTSSEDLAAALPRSSRYLADQTEAVNIKKDKLIFTMQKRQPKNLGSRKLHWRIGKNDTAAQAALRELFGDRLEILK